MSNSRAVEAMRMGAALLWAIWKARCECVFEKKAPKISSIILNAKVMFDTYDPGSSKENDRLEAIHSLLGTSVWRPPPPDFIKINVDGAVASSSLAGAAIARNSSGVFIAAKTFYLSPCHAFEEEKSLLAELQAIYLGVQLADELNLENIIIEGDSLFAQRILAGNNKLVPWRLYDNVRIIQSAMKRTGIHFEHLFTRRDGNQAAHLLARDALLKASSTLMVSPPAFIIQQLSMDADFFVTPFD